MTEHDPALEPLRSDQGQKYGDDAHKNATASLDDEPWKAYTTIPTAHAHRILPLALSASLGMAATVATTVFAYAAIICDDPSRCKTEEQSRYAGAVALATGVSNICGVLALGPLQSSMKGRLKLGLIFWLVSRATSVAVLAIGVTYKSIRIAILGRLFEGFATDNLLHYHLGAIYVLVSDRNQFPRLMGTSLALFMVGMSLSPTIAGLFPNFFTSFIMALTIFGASIMYLALFVPAMGSKPPKPDSADFSDSGLDEAFKKQSPLGTKFAKSFARKLASLIDPVRFFYHEPSVLLPGLALLLYNSTQAYLFPAIMVYTALRYAFTGTENGHLISIAAATSAVYLFSVIYALPRSRLILRRFGKNRTAKPAVRHHDEDEDDDVDDDNNDDENEGITETATPQRTASDFLNAVISMAIQLVVLPCIPLTNASWQIYPTVVLLALGLAAPSFLKTYGVALAVDKSAAVASLAMMESTGGLLSAVVLGSWQSWKGEGEVFFAAAGLVAAALVAMFASLCVGSVRK